MVKVEGAHRTRCVMVTRLMEHTEQVCDGDKVDGAHRTRCVIVTKLMRHTEQGV